MKFKWELLFKIKGLEGSSIYRAKVFGGWIINNFSYIHLNEYVTASESMVFISDPEHLWKIEIQDDI